MTSPGKLLKDLDNYIVDKAELTLSFVYDWFGIKQRVICIVLTFLYFTINVIWIDHTLGSHVVSLISGVSMFYCSILEGKNLFLDLVGRFIGIWIVIIALIYQITSHNTPWLLSGVIWFLWVVFVTADGPEDKDGHHIKIKDWLKHHIHWHSPPRTVGV